MRKRQAPSFILSFLDLLCSALCGVAILVFMFAALRKNAEAARPISARRVLIVELTKAPKGFLVGREIGLAVEDDRGNTAYLDEPDDAPVTGPGASALRLDVTVHDKPSRRRRVQILSGRDRRLTVRAWLRGLDPDHLADLAYASALTEGLEFRLFWSNQPDDERVGRLNPAGGFVSDRLPLTEITP